MPTLTEIRGRTPARPTVAVPLCLDAQLSERIATLMDRQRALMEDELASRKPSARAEIKRLSAEIKAAREIAADETGTLTLRASWTMGEWERFTDANPPRTEDGPAKDRDLRRTGGVVDSDALIESLSAFAHAWDGEALGVGDWDDKFIPSLWPGDLGGLCHHIVSMYEAPRDFQAVRSGLSSALGTLTASAELATSESRRSGSRGGSRAKSSADSTETADE